MKKASMALGIIISLVVILTGIDSRYGLRTIQAENTKSLALHKLEHKEDVLEERLWDLEDRQQEAPTKNMEKDIKKTKSRLEKVQRKINKKLSIGEQND